MCASFDTAASAGAATPEPAVDGTTDRPLSVCLLSYRSDPFSGGQGVYVKHLSRELVARGHSVDVISGKPYPDLDPEVSLVPLPSTNVIDEPDRLRAFRPAFLRSPTQFLEWASAVTGGFPEPYTFGRRVVRYFEDRSPDYDVVHDNQSLCYGLLDLLDRGIPTVATVHHPITVDRDLELERADGLLARSLVRRWYRFLGMQKRVARELPRIIAVSRASKERAVADFDVDPAAATVVHNGIDTERYAPSGRDPVPNRIVSTISSDLPLKGLRHLLAAFARVRRAEPDAELVVMGDFDEGGEIAAQISRLGIGDAITTRTRIPDGEMVELYGTAALAVVPSLYEGFGLPAGEAMACGVPVVATTGGGLPEVIGDAGVLVPPGDEAALARAITRLLADPAERERIGRRGRERVRAEFDWTAAARETVRTYRHTIAHVDG